jgi:hypothetical protein
VKTGQLQCLLNFSAVGTDLMLLTQYFPKASAEPYIASGGFVRIDDGFTVGDAFFGRPFISVSKPRLNFSNDGCPPDLERFKVSTATSGEVLDQKTGLTWKRCAVGQQVNGASCTGSVQYTSQARAFELAKSLPGGWRLPTVKELVSLVVPFCYPYFDRNAFPNAEPIRHWSSTPDVKNLGNAWYVLFGQGFSVYSDVRTDAYSVIFVKK